MKSYLILRNEPEIPLPPGFPGPDIRYPETLVERFLQEFTQEGDIVFDPFAGFGTTLRVAEAMNRIAYGIELNPERIRFARSQLQHPDNLIAGDSRRLAAYSIPSFDFSLTSPPYMGKRDRDNPLTDYAAEGAGYAQYLGDVQTIYAEMALRMSADARAVIEVSNLKHSDGLTTLAWDIARAISDVLRFEGEVIVAWEPTYGYGYDHSYCLVFRKPPGGG